MNLKVKGKLLEVSELKLDLKETFYTKKTKFVWKDLETELKEMLH